MKLEAQTPTDTSNLVPTSRTVNGHALTANVVVSASDLTTGTLPHAQLPALVSGDIPNNAANTSGTSAGLTGTPAITVGAVTCTALTASGAIAANGGSITSTAGLSVACASGANLTLVAAGNGAIILDPNNVQCWQISSGIFRAGNIQVLGWSSATAPTGAVADIGLSRSAAGVLAIGTGAQGSAAGNIRYNRVNTSGTDHAGQATITASATSQAVTFAASYTTTAPPIVVVTPTSDPLALGVPVGYWITYQGSAGAWTGFTVNIQSALTGNVTFNYIVLGQA